MTTRHVERLIDFNHEMLEPLQFHIDEDIHYKKEEIGIRAAGYLYLSGKYKAKDGVRLFQELLEVDILAPYEKIVDQNQFAVHVKDYDYSVRDGDLLIDICIEINGLDEKTVTPPEEIEESEQEEEILEERSMPPVMANEPPQGSTPPEELAVRETPPADVPPMVSEMPEIIEFLDPFENTDGQQVQPVAGSLHRGYYADGVEWHEQRLEEMMSYEEDNRYTKEDRKKDAEALLTPNPLLEDVEDRIRNYVTSQELTELLKKSMDEIGNDPVRIAFDLIEPEVAAAAASIRTPEELEARRQWESLVALLEAEYKQLAALPQTPKTPQAEAPSKNEELVQVMTELRNATFPNMEYPLYDPGVWNPGRAIVVNPDVIHQMNQSLQPKEALYYGDSHARQPLSKDVQYTGFEPAHTQDFREPMNANKPFPWERKELYDQYAKDSIYVSSKLNLAKEGEPMNQQEGTMSDPKVEVIDGLFESDEMKELMEYAKKEDQEKQKALMPEAEMTQHAGTSFEIDEENDNPIADVQGIEDLFEDADNKIVSMRIVIAKDQDSYESIARRYKVNEAKLAQHNHNKPIYDRALVIIPLD